MALGGMGMGALSGASTGSAAFGPIGALAGAAVGGGASLVDSMSAKKEREKERKRQEEATQSLPGRKKMSRVYDKYKEAVQTKMHSMAGLSQAAMDWANMIR